tara:strand:+ start:2549 stop:2998 length:450 start_codon:yes stop_codon:yes gene_type:complete
MSSRLLRSELKEIVKECLIEILDEGIGSSQSQLTESFTHSRRSQDISPASSERKRSVHDNISWGKIDDKKASEDRSRLARDTAKSMTSDPILAEMLADSQSTLSRQINAEKGSLVATQGDTAQRVVDSSNPIDLFGSSAGKWAKLAFDG